MNNSKLVNLLRTFSKSEMKEFEKLVASPFFNDGRNYLPFLKQLKKFYPKFDDQKMTHEYLFSKIYPDKKFNNQIIWNMNSALNDMAEEFLIQASLKKNNFIRNSHIADELSERKLAKLYTQKLQRMEQNLDRIGIGGNFFQYKTQLELGKIRYRFLEDEQHLVPPHIVKKGEFGILNFLRLISGVVNDMESNMQLFNASFVVNIPYEFINNLHLDKVINYAKSNNYVYTYIMEMYYCSIMTVLKPAESSYFFRAKELYEANSHQFEAEEKNSWLTWLTNYCAFKINEGEDNYRKMLFEVNELHLKEIETSRKKDLGKIFYLQVFRNALSINEIEWGEKYIEKYTPYLKHSYQRSMRTLADAFLAFKLKNYDKVIENLGKVKFIDARDKFYVRSLSLRAYYELGEIPTLLYHIDSAKQFVSKNSSLGKSTRINFNIFLNFMSRFLQLSENNNKYELEMLKKEILQDKSAINGIWLVEKIDEIIGKST